MSIDEFFLELEKEASSLEEEQKNALMDEWKNKWEEAKANNISESSFLESTPSIQDIITPYKGQEENKPVVEFNPNLEVEVKEETPETNEEKVEEEKKAEEKPTKKKRSAKEKALWVLTFPLWFTLLIILFVFASLITLSYIAIFIASIAISLYGLYAVVASIFHIMHNVYGGILQLGLGIVGITLIFWIVSGTNMLIKGSWKLLRRTARWIGGY